MRFGLNFGLLGRGSGTPPLIQGDYIWYDYDPDTGYDTLGNGTRIVVDKGNTLLTPTKGQHPGTMHSGRAVTLASGASLDVPINYDGSAVHGSVSIFNHSTKVWEQVGSEGLGSPELVENGDFEDGSYDNGDGTVQGWSPYKNTYCSIENETLKYKSVDDSEYGAAEHLVSNLNTGKKYKFNIENIQGNNYGWGVFNITDGVYFTTGYNSEAPDTGREFDYVATHNSLTFRCYSATHNVGEYGYFDNISVKESLPLSTVFTYNNQESISTVVRLWDSYWTEADLALMTEDPDLIWRWALGDTTTGLSLTKTANDLVYVPVNETTLNAIDGTETLTVSGSATYADRTTYGPQMLRFESSNNIPTAFINTHKVRFEGDGRYIDTGVAIDGSKTDFTMMMAFTLPEIEPGHSQYIAGPYVDTDVGNAIFLRQQDIYNKLYAAIGRFGQLMTFDETKLVHAMCAVFNQATSQLQVALDGEPFSTPFDIVFDGPTPVILFGTYNKGDSHNLTGYIGEGILSAAMETEQAWFEFWDRINAKMCPKPLGQYLDNYSFDCGQAGWDFDPAYPATITDNGDGSLHLKADSNFGSLVPNLDGAFPDDEWVIECKVRNVVGTGKMSLRRLNNTWHNSPDITTDGIHTFEYTGNIKEIHCGAQADANYEADYDYISLRLKNSNLVTYLGDTITRDGKPVTFTQG